MSIDRIGKGSGAGPSSPLEKGAHGSEKVGEADKPFEVSRPGAAAAVQSTTAVTGASPLEQLKTGKLDADGYLNAKIDEATKHLQGVPKVQLDQIRSMLRDQMTADPALVDLVKQATGHMPTPSEE